MTAPAPCPVCRYVPRRDDRPAGCNDVWECSHVDCPNRRRVTAAPCDRVPPPREKQ